MTSIPDRHVDADPDFGFWLYLMSDAILFGLIFATFIVMSPNVAGGPGGAELFDLTNLSMQTGLLLTSSLTVALAHLAAVSGRTMPAIGWLLLTCAFGAGFLALELREVGGFIALGAGPDRSGFLSGFFTLVGTHGLHVTAGLIWGTTLIVQLLIKGPSPTVLPKLTRFSLFWHFLDIVWIGVFSVVYLPVLI